MDNYISIQNTCNACYNPIAQAITIAIKTQDHLYKLLKKHTKAITSTTKAISSDHEVTTGSYF